MKEVWRKAYQPDCPAYAIYRAFSLKYPEKLLLF